MATDPRSDDSRRRIWLAGVTAMSETIFLQAVDIVLGEGEKSLADVPLGTDPASKPEHP